MEQEEKILAIETEIRALKQQLDSQEARLRDLYLQLRTLQGKPVVTPPPGPAPATAWTGQGKRQLSLENFIGLRLIHLIGMVVLVIGLSIGVKYAIDRNLISEGARIGLAYGAGGLLFVLSLRLEKQYAGFSAILFSGAMASAYFTTYGAYVYYGLLSFALAFGLMIAFTLLTVFRAIHYNRQEIALLGLVGAYAIPFLISANADRADLFFLYLALINSGVVFLSLRQGWPGVGRVAQLATWLLFLGWASVREGTEVPAAGIAAGLFFFLLFGLQAAWGRLYHKRPLHLDEVHLLLLNAAAAYGGSVLLWAAALENKPLATVALVHTGLLAVQAVLFHYRGERYAQQWFTGGALLLLLVWIANAWDGLAVTLLWLGAAIVVFVWGVVGRWGFARLASIMLLGLTLLKLLTVDSTRFSTIQKVISYLLLGVLLLVISYFYQKYKGRLFGKEES